MLINKHNLNVAKAASKDVARSALMNLYITPDCTVATDGHVLIQTALPTDNPDDYPVIKGTEGMKDKPCMLPATEAIEAVKRLKKHTLPILSETALVGLTGASETQLAHTDLDKGQITNFRVDNETTYPDYKKILPDADRERITVSYDVDVLLTLLQYIKSTNPGKNSTPTRVDMEITPTNLTGPMVVRAKTDKDQNIYAIVMPIRQKDNCTIHGEPIRQPVYCTSVKLKYQSIKNNPVLNRIQDDKAKSLCRLAVAKQKLDIDEVAEELVEAILYVDNGDSQHCLGPWAEMIHYMTQAQEAETPVLDYIKAHLHDPDEKMVEQGHDPEDPKAISGNSRRFQNIMEAYDRIQQKRYDEAV